MTVTATTTALVAVVVFFARVARFAHFFAVAAQLQDESAKFHVLSRKGTPNNNVLCTSFGKHLRT